MVVVRRGGWERMLRYYIDEIFSDVSRSRSMAGFLKAGAVQEGDWEVYDEVEKIRWYLDRAETLLLRLAEKLGINLFNGSNETFKYDFDTYSSAEVRS